MAADAASFRLLSPLIRSSLDPDPCPQLGFAGQCVPLACAMLGFNQCLALLLQQLADMTDTERFASLAGYGLLSLLEYPRLALGFLGNMLQRPTWLLAFWLLTLLVHTPVLSLLLFVVAAPAATYAPLRLLLDAMLFLFLVIECVAGLMAVRKCVLGIMKQAAREMDEYSQAGSRVEAREE